MKSGVPSDVWQFPMIIQTGDWGLEMDIGTNHPVLALQRYGEGHQRHYLVAGKVVVGLVDY